MKSKKNSILKTASVFGVAVAMLASHAPRAQAGGKLEAAVEGGKLALEYGEKLATLLTGQSRRAPITIANHTKHRLVNLRIWTDSGKVLELDEATSIEAGKVGGVTVAKADSALTGAVGIICYEIQGTGNVFQVMYSIPYNQSGLHKDAKNWFRCWAGNGAFNGAAIFDHHYKFAAEAGKGVETWTSDSTNGKTYKMQGTMVNAGESKIFIDLYDMSTVVERVRVSQGGEPVAVYTLTADGTWKETGVRAGGTTSKFTETRREGSSIYMTGGGRNLQLDLAAKKVNYSTNDGENIPGLYDITSHENL